MCGRDLCLELEWRPSGFGTLYQAVAMTLQAHAIVDTLTDMFGTTSVARLTSIPVKKRYKRSQAEDATFIYLFPIS